MCARGQTGCENDFGKDEKLFVCQRAEKYAYYKSLCV